jgi:mono/diheme cytochrome c family protein
MKRLLFGAAACLVAIVAAVSAQNASKSKDADLVARGKYLVESTGMCADCHTPMTEKGPDMSKHLQGATLMFKATVPVPDWADRSANIAGMKGWTDAEAIKFFTTGVDPNGKTARPPMPAFRYNQQDARAVLAYLRSLAPAGK